MTGSGGSSYGLTREPSGPGSGGGNSGTAVGGSGGGFLHMRISRTCNLDGRT